MDFKMTLPRLVLRNHTSNLHPLSLRGSRGLTPSPRTEITDQSPMISPLDFSKVVDLGYSYNQHEEFRSPDILPSVSSISAECEDDGERYSEGDSAMSSARSKGSGHFSFSSSLSESSDEDGYNTDSLFDVFDMITNCQQLDMDICLAERGYVIQRKLRDTQQGELLLAKSKDSELVAIKKIDIMLFRDHEARIRDDESDDECGSDDDDERRGMRYPVDTNVAEEAHILKTLSEDPNVNLGVVRYIDYMSTDSSVYLVMEYIDGVSFDEFIEIAFDYLDEDRLDRTEWMAAVKGILSQIVTTVHRLHSMHNCCHLNLWPENVMIYGASFVEHDDGSVSIDGSPCAKLVDFGVAKIFDAPLSSDRVQTFCTKIRRTLFLHEMEQCPESQIKATFDATAADMWCIGVILFRAITGYPLFETIDDEAYYAFQCGSLSDFFATQPDVACLFEKQSMSMLRGLLDKNPATRLNAIEAVQHCWISGDENEQK